MATPGTVAGDLDKRAGDFVEGRAERRATSSSAGGAVGSAGKLLTELAKANGAITRPTVRQDLMRLHSYVEIGRYMSMRQKAAKAAGTDLPGVGNIAKLSMSRIVRLSRDVGLAILGPLGTLHAYNSADRKTLDATTGNPWAGMVTEMALFSPAPSIYGGTDEVQKNILGERVLGLPKEPNSDRVVPFRELPKNG